MTSASPPSTAPEKLAYILSSSLYAEQTLVEHTAEPLWRWQQSHRMGPGIGKRNKERLAITAAVLERTWKRWHHQDGQADPGDIRRHFPATAAPGRCLDGLVKTLAQSMAHSAGMATMKKCEALA